MTRQATKEKLKTISPSHQSSPVCALRKLVGFADKSTSVEPTQTQTQDTPLVPFSETGASSSAATISIMGGGTTTPIAVVAGWGVGTYVGYKVDTWFEKELGW